MFSLLPEHIPCSRPLHPSVLLSVVYTPHHPHHSCGCVFTLLWSITIEVQAGRGLVHFDQGSPAAGSFTRAWYVAWNRDNPQVRGGVIHSTLGPVLVSMGHWAQRAAPSTVFSQFSRSGFHSAFPTGVSQLLCQNIEQSFKICGTETALGDWILTKA